MSQIKSESLVLDIEKPPLRKDKGFSFRGGSYKEHFQSMEMKGEDVN